MAFNQRLMQPKCVPNVYINLHLGNLSWDTMQTGSQENVTVSSGHDRWSENT